MVERRIRYLVASCVVALAIVMAASCTSSKSAPPENSSSAVPSTVAIPNVVGLDASAAETALMNAGLSMDVSVVIGFYPNVAVIRQSPRAGTSVEPAVKVHGDVGPASAAGWTATLPHQ